MQDRSEPTGQEARGQRPRERSILYTHTDTPTHTRLHGRVARFINKKNLYQCHHFTGKK